MRKFSPDDITEDPTEIQGDEYQNIFYRCNNIIQTQFDKQLKDSPLKGFLFHGKPGTGKTFAARLLAKQTGSDLIFVDGADVSHGIYGQSEKTIRDIFNEAQDGDGTTIILFDDVESIFMERGADLVREWHFAQNSVFFHEVDNLDTSKAFLILTTNRFDLIDDAIIDRFHTIEYPEPTRDVLKGIAETMCQRFIKQEMNFDRKNVGNILKQIESEDFSTVREVEKAVMEEYIGTLT